jgi:tetratricopeptide (TPR) repeat protein
MWWTWLAFAVLCQIHVAAFGLAPGQIYLGWRGFRHGERLALAFAVPTAVGVGWAIRQLVGADGPAGMMALQDFAFRRYLQPFFDPASNRHAFGLFSASHLAAIVNELLLVAPLALAVAIAAPRLGRTPIQRFLGWASLGCLAFLLLFNPELGHYRDWDILGAFALVYLAWAAVAVAGTSEPAGVSQAPVQRGKLAAVFLLVAGLHHLVPWAVLHAHSGGPESHLRIALANPHLWSRYARGILHEEFAIASRERGDLVTAISDYEAASQAEPQDARYRLGLADAYGIVGNGARAMQEYEAAIRLRPNLATAYNNYAAWLLRSDGDLRLALQHARQAVLLAPRDARFLATLGTAEMRSGDLAKARASLTQARALAPDSKAVETRLEELRELEREAGHTAHE